MMPAPTTPTDPMFVHVEEIFRPWWLNLGYLYKRPLIVQELRKVHKLWLQPGLMPISRKKDSGNEVGVNVIIRVDFSCSVLDRTITTTTVTPFYTLTKLFYYQTFFKLGIVNIYDMNIKPLLIVWWWNIAFFRTVPWLALNPPLGQNTPSTELFSQKNHVLLSNFVSSLNMLFIGLFLANTSKKNRGLPGLFPHKLP